MILDVRKGLLYVADEQGQEVLSGCRASVTLSDGRQFTTQGVAAQVVSEGQGIAVVSPGDGVRPELRWHLGPDRDNKQTLRLSLEVVNTTGVPLAIERLDVLVAPRGFRATPANALQVSQTGWQSWSPSHPPLPLGEESYTPPAPVQSPMLPPSAGDHIIVPWVAFLQAEQTGTLLAGFVEARDQTGVVSVQPAASGHRLTLSNYREGIALPPEHSVTSETVLLLFDTEEAIAFDLYARELADNMGATPCPAVPTGWCSWYYYFTDVTEADILHNLEALTNRSRWGPLEYIQIDDGYQAEIGDWLQINDKFPSGMRYLADRIREQGFKPGIWLAPFLVSERSQTYKDHPDWVLRDHNGEPLLAMLNWGGRNYALDTTHPEVDEWLRDVTRTIVHEWGFEYLKIDFLFAGALRAARHDRTMTSVQAYRRGLEIIKEAAGESLILGCGAPFAPSVGLVHAMRIGSDVAPYWEHAGDPYRGEPSLRNAVSATLAHSWMHGKLWVNDPDCLMLRAARSDLTLDEVRAWTTLVALSGGMVLASDDMEALEPDRAGMLRTVLPVYGHAGVSFGPVVDGMRSYVSLSVEKPWEQWKVAGLFNWSNTGQQMRFDPAEWGLPSGQAYHLFDQWRGEHHGPLHGTHELPPLPVHGAHLLSVHLDRGRPQLIGTTLHLLGGAVEWVGEEWSGGTLRLQIRSTSRLEGYVAIYVPQGYAPAAADETGQTWSVTGRLLLAGVRADREYALAIAFEQSAAGC